ncbi:abortive infection family protein [Humibacter sp.]|uniref:abortive infection family protein n=1 Tax=Humibacter sp. TaxID=1940291 RepID=UPI003F7FBFBB
MASQWRQDAPANLVELAIGKCLIAEMDDSRWTEIGLLTGTKERIYRHPRLLRSLRFGDDDYDGHVYDMVPVLLGAQETWGTSVPSQDIHARFPRLGMVADFIDLPAWLALNEPDLYGRLFVEDNVEATLPDGTVLSEAESAAVRLSIAEMRRQVERIRRDYGTDPEAAIGQAKELIESACKTILGITGDSDEKHDVPALVKQTLLHLGLDPTQAGAGPDERAAKRLLGGVASILNGAGELRNARGTGHGRSGADLVDASLARMAVGVVLPTVIYLIESWEAQADTPSAPAKEMSAAPVAGAGVGGMLRHETFGEGQILESTATRHGTVVVVDFGPRIGRRRILLRG